MYWIWIILIIIGYFVIGSVFTGILTRVNDNFDDENLFVITVFGWPIFIPILLLYLLCKTIIDSLRP